MWITIASSVLTCVIPVICQFTECHHDPIYQVEEDGPLNEMQFKWLGSLQYIHIKNGTPHYFRVPRVILIHRLFVMSTAVDAAQVPEGYALGNVAFSEYERDEHECGVTIYDLSLGATCESAVLLVPLADVLLHPEYKHFGVTESIAILKLLVPIKSVYMSPVCLPFKNFLIGRDGRITSEEIIHIDFMSGGAPCPDPLRTRRPPAPLRHIALHPYVPWITAAITGKALGVLAKDDPFGFPVPRASDAPNAWDAVGHCWSGHWWMGGQRCFDRGLDADDMFKFYSEVFSVHPKNKTHVDYELELYCQSAAVVMCVKVGMPFRIAQPQVTGLGTPEIKVNISMIKFYHRYKFVVEAWAINVTASMDQSDS